MGMCCFDVTRSLTVAGRLWSKDVNRTKTITADIVSSTGGNFITKVKKGFNQLAETFSSPNYALVA